MLWGGVVHTMLLLSSLRLSALSSRDCHTESLPDLNACTILNEPPHEITNKMTCAPSEDSTQPGHLPSLVRVFAVCMKKDWVLSYPLSLSEDSSQPGLLLKSI